MSFLNLISLSFILGLALSVILSLEVNLFWWLFLEAILAVVVVFKRREGFYLKAGLLVAVYLLGMVWLGRAYPEAKVGLGLVSSTPMGQIWALNRMSNREGPDGSAAGIERRFDSLRRQMKAVLDRDLPEPQSSLAYGILFGSKTGGFNQDFLKALRRTGTIHMVAVSGYNVSIISNILLNTTFLIVSKAFLGLGILGLLAYGLVVGFSASVLRALVMGVYLFTARVFGRQKNLTDALLFSAALMLFWAPQFLLDLGFQLSFTSMMAVIYLSPVFERFLKSMPRDFRQVVAATMASQIMVLPLALFNFGQISLIAPLANLLTFLTVPAIMALTSLELGFGSVSAWAGSLWASANLILLNYFVGVVEFLSAFKWAAVTF